MPPNLLSDLRDIHEPVAPGFWPPAPGWWLVLGLGATMFVVAASLARRWQRHRTALRAPYIAAERHIRLSARLHAAGEIDARALADEISDVLKRVLVRVERHSPAATLAGDGWAQALAQRFPQPEFAALGEALGNARFRRGFDADVTSLATAAIDALQKAARERTALARPEGRDGSSLARTAGLRARVRSQLRLADFALRRCAAKSDRLLARPEGRDGSSLARTAGLRARVRRRLAPPVLRVAHLGRAAAKAVATQSAKLARHRRR